jgi:hypothetical protein
MANERAILCGSVGDASLSVGDKDPVRLRMWGPHSNVHLKIEDVRKAMYKAVPTAFLDLIDIAVYVYCADQAITRGGGGIQSGGEIGQNWRRTLFFRIPVRNPDIWKSRSVLSELISTLSFLSEDEYHFEFEHLKKDISLQGYLDFNSTPFDGVVEEVALFSGGLDSVAGAVKESVVDKRKVLLVNHRSTEKLTPRHRHLLNLLDGHAKGHDPLHIPVRINKEKGLGREYTQRSRSFVYASLAATIATMIGLNRIRFYENGVVSLNLPPSAQVVGARATRTTHPQVLNGFARLFSSLAAKPFIVENPFLWKTKTEVVKLIGDAGCGDLIKFSTSCTHTWEITQQHTHCGVCSQCIDRRFAVLAAGVEAHDPAEAYKVDLLVGERNDGDPKTMLAAYLETANEINSMTALKFFSRFGEATRVLRQFDGSPDATAIKIFDLYKLHAKQVTGVIDQAIVRYAPAIRKRELPPSCLVRLVCDASASGNGPKKPPPSKPAVAPSDNIFRKKGQVWQIRFAGGAENILLPSKGAAYLHMLLSQPRTPVSAIVMACRLSQNRDNYSLGSAGDKIDQDALFAYQARYAELKEELEEAKSNRDDAAISRIQGEMESFMEEIRKAKGLGGRIRKDADDRDRVRKAVGNAIRRAVKDIGQFDKRLADHLKSPCLCCGLNPCYSPAQDVTWET